MSSILNRRVALGQQEASLSTQQVQQAQLLYQFKDNLSDESEFAAMTGASFAYRFSKFTILTYAANLKHSATALALAAEVSVWRGLSTHPAKNSCLGDYLQFASLRGAGHLSSTVNPILGTVIQDLSFMGTHHLSQALGFSPHPLGTFVEQWVEARSVNWQMRLGMAGVSQLFPRLHPIESSLRLQSQSFSNLRGITLSRGRDVIPLFAAETTPAQKLYEGKIHGKSWEIFRIAAADLKHYPLVKASMEELRREIGEKPSVQETGQFFVLSLDGEVAGVYNLYDAPFFSKRAVGNGIIIREKLRTLGGLGSLLREGSFAYLRSQGYERIEYSVADTASAQSFQLKIRDRPGVQLFYGLGGPGRRVVGAYIHLNQYPFSFDNL